MKKFFLFRYRNSLPFVPFVTIRNDRHLKTGGWPLGWKPSSNPCNRNQHVVVDGLICKPPTSDGEEPVPLMPGAEAVRLKGEGVDPAE
jgi:hypothetical protein